MPEQEKYVGGPHLVRYGIAADQRYLVGGLLDTYDELVINGRMVAHMAGGLALFLGQRAVGKRYLVDPETHAFQHGIEYLQSDSTSEEASDQSESAGASTDVRLKRSIEKMIAAYGNPIERVVNSKESILPEDFSDAGECRDFCQRVLQFQLGAIAGKAQEGEDAEYYEFLREKNIIADDRFVPGLVIAPYFCMNESTFDEWIGVNISCAKDSQAISRELRVPLGIQIVISQSVLANGEQRRRLVLVRNSTGIFQVQFE